MLLTTGATHGTACTWLAIQLGVRMHVTEAGVTVWPFKSTVLAMLLRGVVGITHRNNTAITHNLNALTVDSKKAHPSCRRAQRKRIAEDI